MKKDERIVFKKYGQFYAGTFQSGEGNKVKVTSLSGTVHLLDRDMVQTREAYENSLEVATEEQN